MKYDIAIIGGGMVGAALAAALDPLSLRIALVDASEKPSTNDPRLIALNYGSICLLKNLNIFSKISEAAAVIHEVHVTHRGHFGSIRMRAKELNLPFLGAVIPAKNINFALEEKLQQTSIDIIRPAQLIELAEGENEFSLTLEIAKEKKVIESTLVIAADGSHSTVRKLLSIPTKTHDYKQSAIVTTVEIKRSHQQTAHERFLNDGALAMLPLTGNRCASIWTASQEKIASLMQLTDGEFLQQLQNEFGLKLGRFLSVTERFVFPLQLMEAKKQAHKRIALIGNAAHTVHPLAAQGFNLALYEVALLTELIDEKRLNEINFEGVMERSFSQTLNIKLSHGLNSMFATDFFPINILRQIGMIGMGILGICKNQFATYPAGRAGPIPRLLLDQEK